MAERKLTPDQEAALAAVQHAVVTERAVIATAEAKARKMVDEEVRKAREATNAALYSASKNHRVNTAALTRRGFGNTNRLNVNTRLKEHAERFGGNVTEAAQTAEAAASTAGLSVTVVGNEVHVILTEFTHADIGKMISGEVTYTTDGTVLDLNGGVSEAAESNPLFAYVLWGLPEVQALI